MEPQQYAKIAEKLEQYPDFMERENPNKKIVQSELILGKLYRGVDTKSYYENRVFVEHKNSILLQYDLNRYIIKYDQTN